jgi:hypothetical protein
MALATGSTEIKVNTARGWRHRFILLWYGVLQRIPKHCYKRNSANRPMRYGRAALLRVDL